MLHPLFSAVLQRPDLVFDHLSAYAGLAHQEASKAASEMVNRVVAWVVAGVLALIFVIFLGMALMLGFSQGAFHWILVTVPGALLVLIVIAVFIAKKPLQTERFSELKSQLDKDVRTLRAVA